MKKLTVLLLIVCFSVLLTLSVCAEELPEGAVPLPIETGDGASNPRVVDMAGLLTQEQTDALIRMADEVSQRQNCDVVIITEKTMTRSTAEAEADDLFDYGGYGIGTDRSGILLLFSTSEGYYWESTRGWGITAFTDYGLSLLEGYFVPHLASGDYYTAFYEFIRNADSMMTTARDVAPIDNYTDGGDIIRTPAPYFTPGRLAGALIVAFLISLIAAGAEKSKLRSVAAQDSASYYEKPGSMQVSLVRDIFLYRNVTRTRIESSSSGSRSGGGGGGSTTHHSSSGASHGGHGGRI